jgi:hypothetical protein
VQISFGAAAVVACANAGAAAKAKTAAAKMKILRIQIPPVARRVDSLLVPGSSKPT